MRQLQAKIAENKKIAQGFYRMRVQSAYLGRTTKPGQFFEVRCSGSDEPLLRRPLGAHRILNNGVEILYEAAGRGTKLISQKRAEDTLDIIGPLGSGFAVEKPAARSTQSAILVAGGIGVAPLVALAEELVKNKKNPIVIIGAKTKSYILCEDEFKSLGCSVSVATEDGSKGKKGLATDLLRKTNDACLPARQEKRTTIYACGPTAMLKAVAKIAEGRQIPCQVSLEERMACGVGVCLGCPVKVRTKDERRKTKDEYKMVCKDGPVFDAKEIAW